MKTENEYTKEWNTLHCELVSLNRTNGLTSSEAAFIRNNKMADYCEESILKAKEAYYNSESPIMTDEQYDRFERNLKILRPDSEILEKVGS